MISTPEIVLIFFIVLLLFGGKRLPELARSLGLGVAEFRKASEKISKEIDEKADKDLPKEKPIG